MVSSSCSTTTSVVRCPASPARPPSRLRLSCVPLVPPLLLAALLLIEARHLDAGPVTALAPAVSGIEGEQTRVELGETAAAGGTGALGGEHRRPGGLRSQHVHQPLAEIERAGQSCAQGGLAAHGDVDLRNRQLDGVLAEARQARPR